MPDSSYDQIRKRIERRYNRRFRLLAHMIMAAITLGALWSVSSISIRSLTLVGVLWAGILMCQALKVFMDELKDRALERALPSYKQDLDLYSADDKPKRIMRLMDNSEVEIIEDEPLYQQNGKGHHISGR